MIEAELIYDCAIENIVKAFLDLPSLLRPVHFGLEEKTVNEVDRIDDVERFAAFMKDRKSGFFLFGTGVLYSMLLAEGMYTTCDCSMDVDPESAIEFLTCMSKAKPIFGYACLLSEFEQRNRLKVKIGANNIETWVGRDTRKYVPGFYWLTLLPEALARQHGVPIEVVSAAALKHIVLEGGQHIFRFYERPEDWNRTAAVTELISSLAGVFNIDAIRPDAMTAKNYLDLSERLQEWR